MEHSIEVVSYGSADFEHAKRIRIEVFVQEQGVPLEEEIEEDDTDSIHILIRPDKESDPVGVCRLTKSPPFIRLGRMAVVKDWRGKNMGASMCQFAIRYAKEKLPDLVLVAHAQTTALKFYAKLGFVIISEEFFDEVNILHHTIVYPSLLTSRRCLETLQTINGGGSCDYIQHSYSDPIVVRNIVNVFNLVESCEFVTFDTIQDLISGFDLQLGRILLNRFYEYCIEVMEQQRRQFIGIEANTSIEDPKVPDESELLNLAWDHLNIGHYSLVGDHWRALYLALSLCKSIRQFCDGDIKDSIFSLDMGLLMSTRLLSEEFVLRRMKFLCGKLPELALEAEESIQSPEPNEVPSRLPQSVDVAREEVLADDEEFLEKYLFPLKPVLFKGAVKDWPAVKKWNFKYLNSIFGLRLVPVEYGSKYTEDDWGQRIMSGNEFFLKIMQGKETLYLAQHMLTDQIPQLKEDFEVPGLSLAQGHSEKDVAVHTWIGPAGTVSPLHTDPQDNLFCQVYGKKFVRMVAPEDTDKVYVMKEGILTNTSEVNVEEPDLKAYPLFVEAKCYDAIVEAGDMLYIPKGYWHHVRSLTPSASLSFWFPRIE